MPARNLRRPAPYRLSMSVFVLFLLVFAAGCKSEDKKNDAAASAPVRPVRVQLSWKHTSEFAPFYMAAEDDDYAKEKIQPEFVSVIDDQGNFLSPVDEVVAGRAQFGIADASTLLVARAEGKPVVAVASLFQHHPMAVLSLKNSEILRPSDLIGKTVQVNASTEEIFYSMLAAQGIDPTQINITQRTDLSIKPLTDGETDALAAWVTNEVVTLIQNKIEYNSFLAYDYGVDTYPNLIFTTEALIKDNPELVQGFVTASLHGITDTLAQRERAVALSIQRDPTLSSEVETLAITQSVPLWLPEGGAVGRMDPKIWEQTYQMILGQGTLTTPMDYTTAYDLTFINNAD